jgi:60 kDa SS-A/Ro ribonucleoprotein
MSLVTAATENDHSLVAFTGELTPLAISPRQRLDDAVNVVGGLSFGSTDCALPMIWAKKHRIDVDTFCV